MARAFTEYEMFTIKTKLKKSAAELLKTEGIKAATLEKLTDSAGISKGAFYKFFPSKELLIFELIKDATNQVFFEIEKHEKAVLAMEPVKRLELIMLIALVRADETFSATTLGSELDEFIYSIEPELLAAYISQLSQKAEQLLEKYEIRLSRGVDKFLSLMCLLVLGLSIKGRFGKGFDEHMQLQIKGLSGVLTAEIG